MKEKIIVKMFFGSHLYGTNTENSDKDYKGIYLPSKEDILLNRISKSYSESTGDDSSKNTSNDIDSEFYSLHYFLKLACEGETVALDMLHAPSNMILETSKTWDIIVENRQKFYTSNLKSFVGYARKQAAKYGIKGSRLNAAKQVLDCLSKYNGELKLRRLWNDLPTGDHIVMLPENPNGLKEYEVCGRKVQESATVAYAYSVIKLFHDNYGERAKQAAQNKGIDWKAISHALRAAFQVIEIFNQGTIIFPLREAEYLKEVKSGKLDYLSDVAPKLEKLMDELEELSEESQYPKKVDRSFWDDFLIKVIENEYFI